MVKDENLDLISVVDVEYVKDYTMDLEFSNGKRKRIDLHNFIQFGLTDWTLEWYNGADFAPDYLYRHGVDIQ